MIRAAISNVFGYVEYVGDELAKIAGVSGYVEYVGTPDTSAVHDVRIAGVTGYVEYTQTITGAAAGVYSYLEYYRSLIGAVCGVFGYVEYIGTPDTSAVHDVRIAGVMGYLEVIGDLIYVTPEPEPPGSVKFGPQCQMF